MIDPTEREFRMSKSLQKDQIDAEMQGAAPYLLQDKQLTQAALMEQLDPEEIIEEIKRTLKGVKINKLTGEQTKEAEPLMNDEGISKIILTMRSVVNKNIIMSAIQEPMINKLTADLANEIVDELTLNWKEYGIKNKSDVDKIEGVCKRMAYAALMRSKEGGERRFLGTTTVENISSTPQAIPQEKKSFFSRFKL
jgi:hypothetical protein